MGRIKSLAIKRTTRKLIETNSDLFTDNFEKNKVVVNRVVDGDKKIRNKIAGYLTKIKKRPKKDQTR